jgi:pilus assembly protein Flp/PilA
MQADGAMSAAARVKTQIRNVARRLQYAAATPWSFAMKNFALSLKRFLVSEDGPTAVEYAVMLALIVVVCLSTIALIGTRANETFNQIANSLPASGS